MHTSGTYHAIHAKPRPKPVAKSASPKAKSLSALMTILPVALAGVCLTAAVLWPGAEGTAEPAASAPADNTAAPIATVPAASGPATPAAPATSAVSGSSALSTCQAPTAPAAPAAMPVSDNQRSQGEKENVAALNATTKEVNADAAVPALIARFNDSSGTPASRVEVFQTLARMSSPKARKFVLEGLKGNISLERRAVWEAVGVGMGLEQLEFTLYTVAAAGPEAAFASEAAGRYGMEPAAASRALALIESRWEIACAAGKLALTRTAARMHPATAAGFLGLRANDALPEIRAAALLGGAACAPLKGAILNALRSDTDVRVKAACIQALIIAPNDEALKDLVACLASPELAPLARQALVKANGGTDAGDADRWREWLLKR